MSTKNEDRKIQFLNNSVKTVDLRIADTKNKLKELFDMKKKLTEEIFRRKWGIEIGNVVEFRGEKYVYLGSSAKYELAVTLKLKGITKRGNLSKRQESCYGLGHEDKVVKLYNSFEDFNKGTK